MGSTWEILSSLFERLASNLTLQDQIWLDFHDSKHNLGCEKAFLQTFAYCLQLAFYTLPASFSDTSCLLHDASCALLAPWHLQPTSFRARLPQYWQKLQNPGKNHAVILSDPDARTPFKVRRSRGSVLNPPHPSFTTGAKRSK